MVESPPLWPKDPYSPVTPYLKPDGNGDSKYLRKVTRFNTVTHIYTKTRALHGDGVHFNGVETLYSIYLAYQDSEEPPYILLDRDNRVHVNPRDHALRLLKEHEWKRLIYQDKPVAFPNKLPKKVYKALKATLERHGVSLPEDDTEWSLGEELYRAQICLIPVPKLKNKECLRKFDWPSFIQTLTEWEFNRDHRIVMTQKAQLLRGIEPRANPHMVMITNGGVGKSSFYKVTSGKIFDKVTRNSLLGYARGPDEIYPGTLHGCTLPVGIDQIESGEWGILDTVFNLMEYGEAWISSGSVEMGIRCKAPISLLGNVTDHSSAEKGMESILNHLTANPTIGRRLGIIIYGDNYKPITQRSSQQRWYEWIKNAQFYRAVEEYALPYLEAIFHREPVWHWLGKEIPGYADAVMKITQSMEPGLVKQFCLEHGKSAQSRVRGAALSVSIAEHLDLIALGEHSIEMILGHAEDLVQEFAAINLESIRNLVENASAEIQACAEAYYRNQPEYVQIIIQAIEWARRNKPLENWFPLSLLNKDFDPRLVPENSDSYPRLSICEQALRRRKRGKTRLNRRLKEFFGFTFEPKDGKIWILMDSDYYPSLGFIPMPVETVESSKLSTSSTPSTSSTETQEASPETVESVETVENVETIEDIEPSTEEEPSVLSRFDKKNIIMASLYQQNPSGQWTTEEIQNLLKYKWGDLDRVLRELSDDGGIYHRLGTWRLTGSGKRAAQEAISNNTLGGGDL